MITNHIIFFTILTLCKVPLQGFYQPSFYTTNNNNDYDNNNNNNNNNNNIQLYFFLQLPVGKKKRSVFKINEYVTNRQLRSNYGTR